MTDRAAVLWAFAYVVWVLWMLGLIGRLVT